MNEIAMGAMYWFGSGVAFAVGVICGVALCRMAGKDTNRQLVEIRADRKAWQAAMDERLPYVQRMTKALECMSGIWEGDDD